MNKTTIKKLLKILGRILIIGFIIFTGLTITMIHVFEVGCIQIPEKPANIPQSAVWTGECETGHWVNLVEIHDGKYHFMLYDVSNGALMLDADFVFEGKSNCIINEDNWQNQILSYKVEADWINIKGGGKFEIVLPAYGGEYWDKDKGAFIWDNDEIE
jgi:hypothetical protein